MRLLHGRIVPTLPSMAWPKVLVMVAQASTGLIETWRVSKLGLLRLSWARMHWPYFADILRVGGVGTINTLQTTVTIGMTTAMVGGVGGPAAVAG